MGSVNGVVGMQHSVVVSVGTDHHPFDRLVAWTDLWLSLKRHDAGTRDSYSLIVQYGTSQPPRLGQGSALLAHDELMAAMAAASAIVTHGGPATIRDALASGRRPFVVPRDPTLGEHVDDHQIRFTRMLADQDVIILCRDRDQLFAALDRAVADESWTLTGPRARQPETQAAVERVASILDEVLDSRRPRRPG